MQGFYGSLWVDRWRSGELDGQGRDRGLLNAKATWSAELGGFAEQPERLTRALEACRHRALSPTLPEFLDLCRQAAPTPAPALPAPKVDSETARARAAQVKAGADAMAHRAGFNHRAWARKILENPKAHPCVSVKFAQEAMKSSEE